MPLSDRLVKNIYKNIDEFHYPVRAKQNGKDEWGSRYWQKE